MYPVYDFMMIIIIIIITEINYTEDEYLLSGLPQGLITPFSYPGGRVVWEE